jgi:hypothetical protein
MKKGIVPLLALTQMQGGGDRVIPKRDGFSDINYI